MLHDISLVATITMGFVLAFLGGLLASKLRLRRWWGTFLPEWPLDHSRPGLSGTPMSQGNLPRSASFC